MQGLACSLRGSKYKEKLQLWRLKCLKVWALLLSLWRVDLPTLPDLHLVNLLAGYVAIQSWHFYCSKSETDIIKNNNLI